MLLERDYSGVSTEELSKFIKERVPENHEVWAELIGLDKRALRRIFAIEYQWTGLSIADRATQSFDLRVDDVFEIIPSHTPLAARKMAMDELEVRAEFLGLNPPTEEEIKVRMGELVALRNRVLGTRSEEQLERLSEDARRSRDRLARNRQEEVDLAAA